MKFEISPKSYEVALSWDDARLYCFSLNIDGKTGWRLPTMKELKEIYESENDFEQGWYWSSSWYNGGNEWAQCLRGVMRDYLNKSYELRIRAIRDLKSN